MLWLKGLFHKYRELILYVFFGGLTTLVSIGSFVALVELLSVHPLNATVASWILAVGFAYATNRKWVFDTKKKFSFAELVAFYGGRVFTLCVELLLIWIFVSCLDMSSTWVKTGAQVVVLIGNYLLSKFLIFRKK